MQFINILRKWDSQTSSNGYEIKCFMRISWNRSMYSYIFLRSLSNNERKQKKKQNLCLPSIDKNYTNVLIYSDSSVVFQLSNLIIEWQRLKHIFWFVMTRLYYHFNRIMTKHINQLHGELYALYCINVLLLE